MVSFGNLFKKASKLKQGLLSKPTLPFRKNINNIKKLNSNLKHLNNQIQSTS